VTGNSAPYGGGDRSGILNSCILKGNSATVSGGGAQESTLNNCTVTANTALSGGGAYQGAVNNSIVYYNTAPTWPNYQFQTTLRYSCSTPLAPGSGNLTNAPGFVDATGGANPRLQPNSPCINSGKNLYADTLTDLDGNPRQSGGTVDMGAYEFGSPASAISFAWLQQYGLPTDGSADLSDLDSDLHTTWQEWIAGTNPTNAASALRMLSVSNALSGLAVRWSGVSTRFYTLERATGLAGAAAFEPVQADLTGVEGVTSFTDTNAGNLGPFFYRVRVQP
jgi:hypothetical protein